MVKDKIDFLDLVQIEVQSGDGGDGVISWRREKFVPMGGPAGGDGGKGGHIILKAVSKLNTLSKFRLQRKFKAQNGNNGASNNKSGLSAEDLIIDIPLGTTIYCLKDDNRINLGELNKENETIIVAMGGKGGRGNQHFATATKKDPHYCEPGQKGQIIKLELELKLLAEIGLIGLPNAGKSTLLSLLSSARPKIANYPFTTIIPNLGIFYINNEYSLTVADIPGLIEGASNGIGLGLEFLRHIEKTKILWHLIDLEQMLNHDISLKERIQILIKNYEIVRKELQQYGDTIYQKDEIIILNKSDLCTEGELKEIKNIFKQYNKEIFIISGATQYGLDDLKSYVQKNINIFINQQQDSKDEIYELENNRIKYMNLLEEEQQKQKEYKLTIDKEQKVFRITGAYIEGLVRVTKFTNYDSVRHFFDKLNSLGVLEELAKNNIESGNTVLIGKKELTWSEHIEHKLI